MKNDNFDLRTALREKTASFVKNAGGLGFDASLALLEMEVRAITQIDPTAFVEEIRTGMTFQIMFALDDLELLDRNLAQAPPTTMRPALGAALERLSDLKSRLHQKAWSVCQQAALAGEDAPLRTLVASGFDLNKRNLVGDSLMERIVLHSTAPLHDKQCAIQTLARHGARIPAGLAARADRPLRPILEAVLQAESLRDGVRNDLNGKPARGPGIARRRYSEKPGMAAKTISRESRDVDLIRLASTSLFLAAAQGDAVLAQRIEIMPPELVTEALRDALRRVIAVSVDNDLGEVVERLIRQGAIVTPAHIESAPSVQIRAILEAAALRQAALPTLAGTAKIPRR